MLNKLNLPNYSHIIISSSYSDKIQPIVHTELQFNDYNLSNTKNVQLELKLVFNGTERWSCTKFGRDWLGQLKMVTAQYDLYMSVISFHDEARPPQ